MLIEGKIYISRRGGLKVMIEKSGLCFSLDQEKCTALSICKNDRVLLEIDDNLQKVIDFVKL
jgi:hypothetical protein